MKNIRYILLISTCCFLPKVGIAEINLTFDASDIVSSNPTLHTHHTPVVLKPISNFNAGVKLAAVCSIVDGVCNGNMGFNNSGGNNIDFNPSKQCSDDGYLITSCPSGQIKVNQCPYDNRYYKNCSTSEVVCNSQGYNITICNKPQYPTSPCVENSAYYKFCQDDNAKACGEEGYSNDCVDGKIADISQSCPYDGAYKKCICNPCAGYDFTLLEAQAEGWHVKESCSSCGGLKYKREAENCVGYLTCDFGGATGATSCMSGNIKMFSSCKEEPKICSAGLWDLDNYYCNGALRCYIRE